MAERAGGYREPRREGYHDCAQVVGDMSVGTLRTPTAMSAALARPPIAACEMRETNHGGKARPCF